MRRLLDGRLPSFLLDILSPRHLLNLRFYCLFLLGLTTLTNKIILLVSLSHIHESQHLLLSLRVDLKPLLHIIHELTWLNWLRRVQIIINDNLSFGLKLPFIFEGDLLLLFRDFLDYLLGTRRYPFPLGRLRIFHLKLVIILILILQVIPNLLIKSKFLIPLLRGPVGVLN